MEDDEDHFDLNDKGWNLGETSLYYGIHVNRHWSFDDTLEFLSSKSCDIMSREEILLREHGG